MERTYGLKIGNSMIPDLLNPRPEQIDLAAIDARLRCTKRFTNNPSSLTVWQHVHLVQMLCDKVLGHPGELHDRVRSWCRYHDDHEGVIGDIPGPLKALISEHTAILDTVEAGIDQAICLARGIVYPTEEVRKHVHAYDKMAETIEWRYVMGEPDAPWNWPIHQTLEERWMMSALNSVRTL